MASKKQPAMLPAGTAIPALELDSVDGGPHKLRSLADGKLVLAFFKTTCPTCQFTFPFLERMHRGSKVPLFAVSQDDAESTREFHAEYGVTMPTLLDRDDRGYPASNAFGISYVPSIFLIENGAVKWSTNGFSKKDLEDLGRTIGCAPFIAGDDVPDWKSG